MASSAVHAVKAGGASKSIHAIKPRPKKLTFFYGLKMFFGTLIDPTSVDTAKHAPVDRSSKSGRSKKGKGSKLGTSGFQSMSGGSFGAVCGPNGCT
jgi:hypothetical protein